MFVSGIDALASVSGRLEERSGLGRMRYLSISLALALANLLLNLPFATEGAVKAATFRARSAHPRTACSATTPYLAMIFDCVVPPDIYL